MKAYILGFALAASLSAPASAASLIFDFAGPAYPILAPVTSDTFADTGATASVTATAINTEGPNAFLSRDGNGLGVFALDMGGGNLDNVNNDEAIVFDFGTPFNLVGATIQIAATENAPFFSSTYQFWGTDNSGVLGCGNAGGLSCITGISTLLASGTATVFDNPVSFLSAQPDFFRYIVATVPTGAADAYRVRSLTVAPIPLPAAGWLLLGATAGLGLMARRRRRSA